MKFLPLIEQYVKVTCIKFQFNWIIRRRVMIFLRFASASNFVAKFTAIQTIPSGPTRNEIRSRDVCLNLQVPPAGLVAPDGHVMRAPPMAKCRHFSNSINDNLQVKTVGFCFKHFVGGATTFVTCPSSDWPLRSSWAAANRISSLSPTSNLKLRFDSFTTWFYGRLIHKLQTYFFSRKFKFIHDLSSSGQKSPWQRCGHQSADLFPCHIAASVSHVGCDDMSTKKYIEISWSKFWFFQLISGFYLEKNKKKGNGDEETASFA